MMVDRRLLRGICGLAMCLTVVSCSGVDKSLPGPTGPSVNNGVGGGANNDVTGGVGRIAYMRRSLESG